MMRDSLRKRPHTISMMVCCNEPATGGETGFADAFEFGWGKGNFAFGTDWPDVVQIAVQGPEIPFRWVSSSKFELDGQHFDCASYKYGVGNWCWDGAMITKDTLRQLAPVLKRAGFEIEDAPPILSKWWSKFRSEDESDGFKR